MKTSPEFDVLGLGCAAVDDLVYVETYPPADAKISVLRTERHCGGLNATALVAASRLGSRCAYAGVLGTDELSQFGINRMREEGIDLTHLRRRPEARIVHSFIVVDIAHNTRNIFADLNGVVGADPDWPPEEVIRSSRVLLIDHFGLPGMIRAARIARNAGVPVVADFEKAPGPEFSTLLELVDHLILSEPFARKLTGKSSAVEAAASLWAGQRSVVAVTCGKEGCWYLGRPHSGGPKHLPAFAVKAVDTTGCGDVFHGAYASALARDLSLEECLRFASASAALKAMQPGGQSGIPGRPAVEAFLANGNPSTPEA
ncbi:MAG: hypothetical protein HY735_00250 [Verrucomicrobia bacterium]|nr:hypothetical protein [Verrucomicrobiota bacterium]